ncbi:hypothetical protein BLNAU_22929 [Blattamonas nauphoetae]|uniref:Lebercilin domain-containing protein n=1 Tax=Blattamonas nauphoetae TaxID=2049346 RepID=A0ABQ9WRQ6_9EUKA|nr:hypothetical protein BLNAU_22929 [Blattamonas nauphoetae]
MSDYEFDGFDDNDDFEKSSSSPLHNSDSDSDQEDKFGHSESSDDNVNVPTSDANKREERLLRTPEDNSSKPGPKSNQKSGNVPSKHNSSEKTKHNSTGNSHSDKIGHYTQKMLIGDDDFSLLDQQNAILKRENQQLKKKIQKAGYQLDRVRELEDEMKSLKEENKRYQKENALLLRLNREKASALLRENDEIDKEIEGGGKIKELETQIQQLQMERDIAAKAKTHAQQQRQKEAKKVRVLQDQLNQTQSEAAGTLQFRSPYTTQRNTTEQTRILPSGGAVPIEMLNATKYNPPNVIVPLSQVLPESVKDAELQRLREDKVQQLANKDKVINHLTNVNNSLRSQVEKMKEKERQLQWDMHQMKKELREVRVQANGGWKVGQKFERDEHSRKKNVAAVFDSEDAADDEDISSSAEERLLRGEGVEVQDEGGEESSEDGVFMTRPRKE